MVGISHKWLGDAWRMVGDHRKARDHHAKHLQFNTADVSDLSGEGGVRNKAQVLALCRQERLNGAAAKYVLNSVAQTSIDQQRDGEMGVDPKSLGVAVQVRVCCVSFDGAYSISNRLPPLVPPPTPALCVVHRSTHVTVCRRQDRTTTPNTG